MADPRDKGRPAKTSVDQTAKKKSNIKAPDPILNPVKVKGKGVKYSMDPTPAADPKNPRPAVKVAAGKAILYKKDKEKLAKKVLQNGDRK